MVWSRPMSAKYQGKVLIVDDDREFGLVAKTLVEEQGFKVCLATTGPAALRQCTECHIDIVLLDWVLGNTSGLLVLRQIKCNHPNLPVIVITGHGSMESAAEAVREAAFDYIGKP